MRNFKEKNYKILIGIMVLIIGIIGISKLGSYDLNKGKVHLSKAVIENKLNASVIEAKGYEEITYPIFYTLEKVEGIEKRNVVIKASLTKDENKYAKFKEIKSENITSTLTENGSKIEIRIENVELGKEEKLELKLQLTGAPNGYKINPKVEIKEETEEKYTKIEAKEIEVKTNSITGIIKDEEGMSVSNIEISINKEGQEIKRTVTNEEGRYVFSDIEEGRYELKIEEEIYELENKEEIEVKEGIVKDIKVKKARPYKIEVNKYIEKVKINNKEYTYENLNRVNQSIKNAKEITGEIEYKVVVKNTGTKEEIITKVEEEKIEGLKFNKEKNKGWEEKEGKIYNNSLEGLTIKAGEEKKIKLILDIEKTEEAKSYLTRVTVKGEVYEKVSYILDNKIYKEEEVLEGEKIEEEKLEIEGFSGWYTDKNYTNKYNFEKGVTKDLILYGKTKEAIKKYTVTYIDEGQIVKKEELEEGSIISAPEVTKEGHTFIGWYEKENKYDVYEPITRDLILESKYEINKYKITFKNYDGSVLEENETKYKEKPVYKGETPKREKDEEYSYIFDGWDKELEEATKEEEYTAVYKKEKNKYTVTYINEGIEYHKETLEYGSVITNVQDPIKEGYTFTGWYTKDNQKINHPITVTKNITLYSKYEINVYTVSFYHNNEKYVEDQKVNYGENAIKPSTDPTKEDYNFSGWVIKGTNNKYDFNQKVTKDIELESSFIKKTTYTVTFKIGNEVILTENVIEGHKVTSKEAPNKKGYLFDKWYSDEALTKENNFDEKIMSNKTIYGKYNENKHTVTYINEGTTYYTEEVLDSFTAKGPSVNPEKEGYTFKYFSKDKKVAFDYNIEITEDITLYAVYEINTYKVVFKNYDGSVLQEETLDYGSTPVYKKDVPTREKTEEYTYEFKSWDKEITNVTSNQEYIATYKETKNQYKIIFTNYDGSVLQEETLDYGSEVTYKGSTPTREKTKEYTYTFTGWDKEITKVLKNETYIAVYKEEKNKYTVTFMDEERIYGKKEVEYNSVVTDTENHPSKAHYIFKGWTLNDEIYDFNSPVTEDITLKSLYEKVEEPVITHTPTEWTKNNVTVSITSDHSDYKYLYKIDNGEYKEYTGEFTVSENCIVVAKSVKENVESEITTHEITNIDKIAPTISSFEQLNVRTNSFDIEAKAIDNESGLKEIRIYKDNIYQTSISYTDNYNDEKTMSYTLENLEEDTTYRIKIQAIDVAGNISEGIEKEFSTSRNVIVARIIGRNNSLYESEDDYENFNSLENAINACPEGQCTIEMVLDTKESVEVLEGQDITLDVNGKTITGVRNYTIQNSGNLIIVDKANEAGSILNKDDTALRNINNGLLQLGKNEEELVVSKTNPNIVGTIYGVYTDDSATFNFFDGRIEANQAIKGNVDETPYSYNADVAISDKQVATLSVLIDPEARVGTTYYSKVQSAIDDSANGVYLDKTTEMALVKGFDNSDTYGFDYDEENNRLISNNDLSSTTAVATTVVDLTSYTSDQKLTIEGFIDKIYEYTSYNKSYGYVEVLKKDDNKNIGSSRYDSESPSSQYFVLPYGSKYIVNIKYIIPGYRQEKVENSHFIISKMNLSDYKTDKYNGYTNADDSVTTINYSFDYDETTKTYKSNNQYISGSRAFSYIPIDLTNETDDYQLTVNAQVDSIAGSDYGIINVNETNEILKYTNSNGLAFISETSNEYHNGIYNFNKTLTAGKKYYLQFYYFKNDSNGYPQEEYNSKGSNDQFIINSIDLVKLASDTTTLNLDEKLKYSGKMGFTDKINNKYMSNVQTEENTLIDSYVELDFTKMQYDQLVNLNTYNSYDNYQYFYLSTSPNNVNKDLILNDKDSISNLIYFYGKPSSLYINGSSYTGYNTDKKFVLSKGNKYYLHFAVIKNMRQYSSTYSDFAINSVSYTSVLDNKLNVGILPSTTGTDEIISHPIKTSEFALDESKDEELRYIGSNANNYVTFNDEIWRILGVFKTEDKKGNKDFRIKLVRSSSIGYYSWDTSDSTVSGGYGINEWSQADAMKLLNPGYDDEEIGGSLYYNSKSGKCYNGSNNSSTDCDFTSTGLKDSAKEFIDTVKWNTGALPYETASYNLTPNQIYNYENGTNTGKTNYENHNNFPVDNVERTYYWYGQVGLISPTDLIMASSDSSQMSRESCMISNNNYYYCVNNNNWFRNMSSNSYYVINPAFSTSNNSSYYPYIGYSIYNSPYTTNVASNNAILPTVYLKTNVSIKSGDGTSSNPYVLELLDKKNTDKYYGLAFNIEKEETNAEENIIKTEKTNDDYKQLKSFTSIYGFTYDEETKTYTNENINIPNSRAISAIKIDLTNETEEKTILFNYDFKSSSYLSEMYINVMVGKYTPVDYFSTTGPNSIYSVGPVLANSTSSVTSSVKYTFKPGQVYYVQFSEYNSYRDYEQSYLKVSFDYVLDTEKTENFTKYEYSYPVLNEKPDTVVLLNNITLSNPLIVEDRKKVILDLKGKTLTTSASDYVIKNDGNLTIIDSKYDDDVSEAQRKYEEEQAKYDQEYDEALAKKDKTENKYQSDLKKYNDSQTVYEYDYTGEEQTFTAPRSGYYKLETWGAQGGDRGNNNGGKGGYSTGIIYLEENETIYIYVGGNGTTNNGYNGGGLLPGLNIYGGGATDIRVKDNTLYNRVIVAGGGGSVGATSNDGGYGGGLVGGDCKGSNGYISKGGTQTSGGFGKNAGSFGQGGNGVNSNKGYSGAGGGGWYGGGGSGVTSYYDNNYSGSGGSGFVWNESSSKTILEGYLLTSDSYLLDASTISGDENIPNPKAEGFEIGHSGNGYARISYQTDDDGNVIMPNVPLKPTNGYTTNDYVKNDLKLQLDGLSNNSSKNWKDLSDNENDGTITGPVYKENGYYFDGSNDYVSIGEINSDNVTIEATITPQISDSTKREVLSNYRSGGYDISIQSGYIQTGIYINNSYQSLKAQEQYEIGKTYVVQVTYNGKEIKLYVNGELQGTLQVEGTIGKPTNNTIVMLGSNPNGTSASGNYYKGTIYTARIYNKALTESELNKNYNSDSKRYIGIIRKEAEMASVIQTGNIESANESLINNSKSAYLNIERGILNVKKSGLYSAINNYGTVTIGEKGIINLYQSGNIGITNQLEGTILDGAGTINNFATRVTTYGIYNYDYTNKEINGYTINNSTIAYYKNHLYEQTLNNFTINGGTAISYDLSGTGEAFNIKNSTINATISTSTSSYDNGSVTINIDNSEFNPSSNPIINNRKTSKIIVSNSRISSDYPIKNYGEMEINDTEINNNNVNSRYDDRVSIKNYGTVELNNTIININNDSTNGIYNYNDSSVTKISGNSKITTKNGTNYYAIYNYKGITNIDNIEVNALNKGIQNASGTISIKSGKFISTNASPIVNNAKGTITIGEKEENKDEQIPKDNIIMTGKTYGIYNPEGTVNYYDGIATAALNQSLYGSISDTIEGYDINIDRSETTETVSLKIPTNFVVQIGEEKYTTIQSAVDSITETTETQINLISNIETINNVIVPENKNIILNLNGYTVKSYKKSEYIINNGTLKLIDTDKTKNGNLIGSGITLIENNNNLTIEETKLSTILKTPQVIDNKGTTIINNSTIKAVDTENGTINNEENATLNVADSIITKTSLYGANILNSGTATFDNTTFNNHNKSYKYNIVNNLTGNITINGGTYSNGNFIYNYGTATINNLIDTSGNAHNIYNSGGILNLNNVKTNEEINNDKSAGTINITGGNYSYRIYNKDGNLNISEATIKVTTNDAIYNNSTETVNIEDATIESTKSFALNNTFKGTVNIKNSTLTAKSYGIYNQKIGSVNVIGNTSVTSTGSYGIYNESTGTVNIGEKDGNVSIETPIITGKTYGVYNNNNDSVFNFYDGVIKGETGAIYGKVTDIETDYEIISKTENGVESKYLSKLPVAKIVSTNEEYFNIQDAINSSTDGDTIQLLRDITTIASSSSIIIGEDKNVILDFNSYTINISNEKAFINNGILKIIDSNDVTKGMISSKGVVAIENNGTLSIDNIKISSDLKLKYLINNNGILNLLGGEVSSDLGSHYDNSSVINNNGEFNLSGGTISSTSNSNYDSSVNKQDYSSTIINNENATFNMTGGTISKEADYGYLLKNKGTAVITDGKLEAKKIQGTFGGPILRTAIYNTNTGTLNVSNIGYVNSENDFVSNYGISNLSNIVTNSTINNLGNGTIKIIDSTISLVGNNTIYNESSGIINVTGSTNITSTNNYGIYNKTTGTINVTGESNITSTGSYGIYNESSGTINIGEKDGNVSAVTPIITGKTYGICNKNNNGILNFYDGIIKGETGAIYGKVTDIEPNYEIISKIESGVESKYLAQLPAVKILSTNEEYLTLQEAFAASETGDTLQVLRNITILESSPDITIDSNKNITLELNGYTINTVKTFVNDGILKIQDSTEENNGKIDIYGVKFVENNNKITIEKVNLSSYNSSSSMINNNGTAIIKNSTMGSITNAKNATLQVSDSNTYSVENEGIAIINDSKSSYYSNYGNLKVNSVTLSSGLYNYSGGTVEVSNGSLKFVKNDYNNEKGTSKIKIKDNSVISSSEDYLVYNYGSGTIDIEDSTVSSGGTRNTAVYNRTAKGTINLKNSVVQTFNNGVTANDGTLNIINSTVTSTNAPAVTLEGNNITANIKSSSTIKSKNYAAIYSKKYGTINIEDSTIISESNGYTKAVISNKDSDINIKGNTNITSTTVSGIYIYGTGTVNIGEKDGNVSTETPIITGIDYGINNSTGVLNFYDGIITGKTAISGGVNEIESGYKINIANNEDDTQSATLILAGDDEKVVVINNINFSDLQSAINYAPDNATSNITIYANITLDSNIVVPAGKTINIYLNGYTITKGNYDFTGEGKVTLIEGTNTTNALASIIENVKEVLNIDDIKKNIIIYEMDDGSKITSEKTYKLYKIVDNNKEEVKLKEEEIGKYNVENKEDEIRTVKGRIYINNLPKGNYELISNDNKKASFEITDTGKLVGKIKENINESKPVIVSAIAELIITIQTGTTYINYILIIIILLSIIASLYLVQKKTNKKYLS